MGSDGGPIKVVQQFFVGRKNFMRSLNTFCFSMPLMAKVMTSVNGFNRCHVKGLLRFLVIISTHKVILESCLQSIHDPMKMFLLKDMALDT